MNERDARREAAVERIRSRRELTTHVVVYSAVNVMLIVIWALSGGGYFWPIWPIVGWGIGLALHAWTIFGRRPITDDDIQNEIRRSAH